MPLNKLVATQPAAPASEQADKARVTAKGIRSLRKRLGLSQAQFAKVVGVTDVAVYLWERKSGALRLRPETRVKILATRSLSTREAKQRLEEMASKAKVKAPTRRRKTSKAGKKG